MIKGLWKKICTESDKENVDDAITYICECGFSEVVVGLFLICMAFVIFLCLKLYQLVTLPSKFILKFLQRNKITEEERTDYLNRMGLKNV